MTTLNARDRFNALSNADHIFAFCEDKIPFKILDIVNGNNSCKAVVQLTDDTIKGLFTDSSSAINALHEVKAVFDTDQPFILVKLKKTAKDQSVYYAEIVEEEKA